MAVAHPKTMEELVDLYDGKLRTLVRNKGLSHVEDDVVQSVYLYFLEHDLLGRFDSERGVAFSTYFWGYAKTLVLRFYNKQKRAPSAASDVLEWVAVEYDVDGLSGLSFELLEVVLNYLYGLPVRGQRDLFRLFVDALKMINETGSLNQTVLARKYGLSTSSIRNQLNDLASILISWGFVVADPEEGKYVWSAAAINRARCDN